MDKELKRLKREMNEAENKASRFIPDIYRDKYEIEVFPKASLIDSETLEEVTEKEVGGEFKQVFYWINIAREKQNEICNLKISKN